MNTARYADIKWTVRDMTIRVGRFDKEPDGIDVHNIGVAVGATAAYPLTQCELSYLRLCWADAVAMDASVTAG